MSAVLHHNSDYSTWASHPNCCKNSLWLVVCVTICYHHFHSWMSHFLSLLIWRSSKRSYHFGFIRSDLNYFSFYQNLFIFLLFRYSFIWASSQFCSIWYSFVSRWSLILIFSPSAAWSACQGAAREPFRFLDHSATGPLSAPRWLLSYSWNCFGYGLWFQDHGLF